MLHRPNILRVLAFFTSIFLPCWELGGQVRLKHVITIEAADDEAREDDYSPIKATDISDEGEKSVRLSLESHFSIL